MDIPIAVYDETNDFRGTPQIIKGINFYPIKMMDTETIEYFNFIFSYSRSQMYFLAGEDILERKIIYPWLNVFSSKYQKYINVEGCETLIRLKMFLSKITDFSIENIKIGYLEENYIYNCENSIDKKIIVQFNKEIEIENKKEIEFVQFSGEEFNIIREFIIKQNGRKSSYIDEWNNSFEEDLKEYLEHEKIKFPSFSDDIFTYKALSHLSFEEINKMTLCQFVKDYEKLKQIKDYDLVFPFYMSGKMGKDAKIKHYTMALDDVGRYDLGSRISKKDFVENNDIMK